MVLSAMAEGRCQRGACAAAADGFTLLELTVALALLMLISGLAAASFSPWLLFQQRIDTDARLVTLQAALLDYLDRDPQTVLGDADHAVLPVANREVANGSRLTDTALRASLAGALRQPDRALNDGFNQPWLVFVSRGLVRADSAGPVHYRVVALVSAGANGLIDAGTSFDIDTGVLTLAGDDRGALVDGYPAAQQRLVQVGARAERLAQALQTWFQLRWQGDADRDASIDYFAAPCAGDVLALAWDGGADALPNGCGQPIDARQLAARLALVPADLLDGIGGYLRVDNSSAATRNPDHVDPAQRLPPYSVVIEGDIPGGERVQRAVMGTF